MAAGFRFALNWKSNDRSGLWAQQILNSDGLAEVLNPIGPKGEKIVQ